MSTSGAGFAASGALQGFAQSYNAAHYRRLQMDLDQRHQLAGTLAMLYQNARPEAQADIGQRILQIYSTPIGKKLDKNIGDVTTLGRAQMQAALNQGAAGTPPGATAPGIMQPPPGGAPPTPPTTAPFAASVPPPTDMGATAPPALPSGIPKPPDLSQPGAGYSPLLSADERARQAAHAAAITQEETISAQIRARDQYLQAHPDADPAEVAMALGHQIPAWMMQTKVIGTGILGSEMLKTDPNIRTISGQMIDPNARYDLGSSGFSHFALPSGVKTEATLAGTALKGKALDEKIAEFKSTDQYRRWKELLDKDTQMRIAQMRIDATVNKAPAAMMQTAVFAKGGLERITDAEVEMSKLESSGVMGSLPANKVEDWIFGKGLVDPTLPPDVRQSIGKMRAALGYTSSAAMRAHTGRTSREIYDDFKSRLGAGQDWSALKGAIDETRGMLADYAMSASDENIKAIRGGTNVSGIPTPPKTPPSKPAAKGGAKFYFTAPNGKTYTFVDQQHLDAFKAEAGIK